MQIICPNCGSKSPFEAGALATQTRILCAGCRVEFDALLEDERPHAAPAPALAPVVAIELHAVSQARQSSEDVLALADVDDLLPLTHAREAASLLDAEDHSPANPFESSGDELGQQDSKFLEAAFASFEASRQPNSVATVVDLAKPAANLADENEDLCGGQPDEDFIFGGCGDARESDAGEDGAPRPALFDYERVPVVPAQALDKYSLGVRLMRVSPMWLLVSGLSFITFVVFCNWFFVPANATQPDERQLAVLANHATNQSSPPAPANTSEPASSNTRTPADAEAHADDQRADSTAQQAATQEPPNEPAQQEQPQPQTAVPTPDKKPTERPAEPEPARAAVNQAETPVAGGGFTVQIGSYNVASEAQARAASLKAAGFESRVAEVEIPKRGKWYRVQSGRFGTRAEADGHGRQLRSKGLAPSYLTAELQ